jgi:hypothetical protein
MVVTAGFQPVADSEPDMKKRKQPNPAKAEAARHDSWPDGRENFRRNVA